MPGECVPAVRAHRADHDAVETDGVMGKQLQRHIWACTGVPGPFRWMKASSRCKADVSLAGGRHTDHLAVTIAMR